MFEFDSKFWVGLALAVPLSIVANLLTLKVQNIISGFSSNYDKKRKLELTLETETIEKFIKKPHELYIFLLSTLLGATLLSSVIGVFSCMFFLTASLTPSSYNNSIGLFFIIFGGLLVAKICLDAIKIVIKYKARVRELDVTV
jgi:di/tricarboxylate transporter